MIRSSPSEGMSLITVRRDLLLCLGFLAFVFVLSSGTRSASAQTPGEGSGDQVLTPYLSFDHVAGMTKGAVTSMAQDDAGFLWFGTEEGLSRYDGYQFVHYAPDDQSNDFTVTALAVNGDEMWVSTDKGLDRLDLTTKKFTHIKNDPKDPKTIASDFISSIALDKSGNTLWLGTADSGVDSLNLATKEVKHYRSVKSRNDSLSSDEVSVVTLSKDGKLWIGTQESGLNVLDPKSEKITRYAYSDQPTALSSDNVTSLYQDSDGVMWIGTMDGLNRFDPKTNLFQRYLIDADDPKWISAIVQGDDGGLWLGIKGIGVYRLDRTTGTIEKYIHDPADASSLGSVWTRVAFSDRSGVLWFGFNAGSVSKLFLMRRDFTFYRTNPGLSFLEDGDKVWLGTQGHGLRLLDLKTGDVKPYLDDQLSSTWAWTIIAGAKGSLWIGTTDRGLFHFTPATNSLESYDMKSGLRSDSVFALLREQETLWIGTYGAGLGKLDTNKKTIEYMTSDKQTPTTLSSDSITSLAQDRTAPQTLWVGTVSGLNKLDKRTGKVVRYMHDSSKANSLSNDHINNIHEDHLGRMWISTWGGGLDLMDRNTGTFTAFTHGLASDVVYGILEDKSGALWLTTDNGLTKFDPDKKTFITFRAGDGLQDDEFGGNTFHQGASGRFYIGGPRGFNVFMPEQVKADTYVPPVALTKFEILGDNKPIPKNVSLSYRDRWFGVEFSSLAYASPERNRYKYRLTGFHDWIETDRRFVSYSSLPPGDYTLEIEASNGHGVWNDKGIRLPIHVAPPFWRTWWAYLAYVLVVVLIGGYFVLRQRTQLEALRKTHRLAELEREVALTSAIQEGFLPVDSSVRDGVFGLDAFYRPAAQCGGDWWTYEQRGERYLVVVGDTTGHGIGSAMVTAAAATCFRSLGNILDDDARMLAVNEEVRRVSRHQYHMTLTAVDLNVATGQYEIWSAGGVPVFSMPPGERPKVVMCAGTPLGSPEFKMGRLTGQLVPGERLLILTDGIQEVATANNQMIGTRGVANMYMATRDMELDVALAHLLQKVDEVGEQADDWTVVMVQWGNSISVDRSEPDTLVASDHQLPR